MKRFFAVLLVTLMTSLFFADTASAGWSQQYSINIPAYGSQVVGFYPLVAGDHKIEFLNDAGVWSAGYMASYWGSYYEPGVWNWWADSSVLSRTREQDLYAGSDDIIFRFIFYNTTGSTHTFYYRFYTDD